jgi:hypothetical protein
MIGKSVFASFRAWAKTSSFEPFGTTHQRLVDGFRARGEPPLQDCECKTNGITSLPVELGRPVHALDVQSTDATRPCRETSARYGDRPVSWRRLRA